MSQFDKPFDTPEAYLAHYGVKGMKWGVRKDQYRAYQDRVYKESPGAVKTVVLTKNGDTLSIEKENSIKKKTHILDGKEKEEC